MMSPELIEQLPSLGISGLLFVMWWMERQERGRNWNGMQEALKCAAAGADLNEEILKVIRANTEALTALRAELASARLSDGEWRTQMMQELRRGR